ncbi:MAG TPA: DUF47 family protein [Pseudothermotoga sp.]|nr:DUF47 family protein [Pseudothermotoga sp.]HOK84129.1 DUF47 family protein [Pseudothermotoga sp.]HPP69128.1 DUF47 family protein [Pseudothermotoga sp.]
MTLTRFVGKMFPKQSPLRLLYEHALVTQEAAKFLIPAMKNYFENNSVDQMCDQVDRLEDKADELKIMIRESYSKLKFVYFDRVDILTILHEEDAVIDAIDDFLKSLTLNRLEKPLNKEIRDLIFELAENSFDSVQMMTMAIGDLLTLVESSFSRSVASEEDKLASKVETNESRTDRLSLEVGKKIFSMKNTIHPVDLYFLEKLVRLLTRIADHAENVAERIRMITHI